MAQAFIADAIQPCPVQEDNGRPTSAATAAAAEPNQETLSWKYSETPGSSVSGDTIFEESGVQKPSVPLTVNEPARVKAELDQVINADQNPSKTITVVKWLAMLFMSLAFLTCLTISKLSLLRIGADLMAVRSNKSHQLTTAGSGSPGNKSYSNNNLLKAATSPRAETDVLMLILIILIPYGTTLLRSIIRGGFRSDKPWPSWSALGLCVLGSLLESFGISLFTIDVLSDSPRYISVLLMNGVFLVPIVVILYKKCRGRSNGASNHRYFTVVMIFALVFEVAGVVLTFVFELSPTKSGLQTSKLWEVPVALVCLSLAWCPAMLRAQMIPRTKTLKELVKRRRMKDDKKDNVQSEEAFHPNQPDSGHVSRTSSIKTTDASAHNEGDEEPMGTPGDPWDLIAMCPEVSARWKSTIITSILKIILVPVFCILLGHLMHIIDVHKLQEGLKNINSSNDMFPAFMSNIFVTLGGYLLGWGACVMCMRISAFAVPLTLATPVALLLTVVLRETCNVFISELHVECHTQTHNMTYTLPAALCFYIAQLLSTGFFIYKTQTLIMQKESQIFWLPGYNGIFLEQWMLLDRKNVQTDEASKTPAQLVADTHVFMCTTMYREAPHEMEQLLQSIKGINRAKQESDRNIESHIFFDNGVRGTKLTEFPLQLVSVAKKVLGVTTEECTRVLTPYGTKLTWKLQTVVENKTGMVFSIHLKDNRKVKNKKRWSQVMYMSYVLDFIMRELKGATEENTYILATDADVKFSPQSVEALLDLMTRDNSVGAVCARTHPMGSGPVVWYQIFDYAIGHWLQKAANHVLGSVLCCPGCFSVYRAAAIKDVLTTYASSVDEASEFLTKDMGEDRWLCTLMVQSGWKLEYCAAAEDKTYCPEDFDEFFKQRRRWIPSTLANQFLVLSEWNIVSFFNKQMSFMFMLYQAMLLFSTLINPSVCILIIVGGLYYAWGVNQVFSTIMLILVTIVYTIICLKASQKTQLMAAKVLTTVFALIMAAVTIGTAEEIVQEYQSPHIDDLTSITTTTTTTHKPSTTKSLLQAAIYSSTTTASHFLAQNVSTIMDPDSAEGPYKLPASVSTLYLGGLTGIFLITALLHLPEAYCLIHGIWYLLCLPGGNLVLMVYSICNMTDRSWGTREEKQISDFERPATFQENFKSFMKKIFFCWNWKTEETVKVNKNAQAGEDSAEVFSEEGGNGPDGKLPRKESWRTKPVDRSHSFRFHFDGVGDEAVPVGAWLPQNFKRVYAKKFEDNGYEDTSFIGGMNEKELTKIGVKSKAHRNALLEAIRKLPEPEIEPAVPDHVDDWLEMIGLEMYQDNFRRSHIITRNNMEILKAMNSADLTAELGITKQGHLKRLMLAICKLRYPSETERSISQVKYEVEALHTYNLEEINVGENEFWEELRKQRLLPDSVAFAHDHDLRGKLTELRNSTLIVFAISNAIWIILITTLVTKGSLNVLNTNVLGLCFLVIFGLVLCVQFICMIIHRCSTFMHLIARAPYKCGQPYNDAWSFQNSWERKNSCSSDASDAEAALIMSQHNKEISRLCRQEVKAKKRPKRSKLDTLSENEEETQRLLRDDPAVNYRALPGPSGKVNRNLAEGYDAI